MLLTIHIQLFSRPRGLTSVLSQQTTTKVLKTNDSLMEVESIAECSLGAFCNTFDLYYLFDLILYPPVNIFQLCHDGPSWV